MLEENPKRADIIMMDIHMPNVSGIDACKQIREANTSPPKSIPIIAMSADEYWHNSAYCKVVGFDGVLPKPISLCGLKEVLQRVR